MVQNALWILSYGTINEPFTMLFLSSVFIQPFLDGIIIKSI